MKRFVYPQGSKLTRKLNGHLNGYVTSGGVEYHVYGMYNSDGSINADITEKESGKDGLWARTYSDGLVAFVHNGHIIAKMQLDSYNPDDYANVGEYVDSVINSVIDEMEEM